MAVVGLLVHSRKENLKDVEIRVSGMPDMTTYGTYQDQYLVVVAEAPSDEMETRVERLKAIDGVLAVYTTYVSFEDELTDVAL